MKLFVLLFSSIAVLISVRSFPQEIEGLDPEMQDVVDDYKNQNENIPREVVEIIPDFLTQKDHSWSIEHFSKMLLQSTLSGSASYIKVDGMQHSSITYRAEATVFNMKSPNGKLTANASLKNLRLKNIEEWKNGHAPEEGENWRTFPFEKITLQKGYILLQKRFTKEGIDEMGAKIPALTEYAGFLYLEIDNGVFTAETDFLVNKKTVVDSILKYSAERALSIKWESYFK